LIADLHAQHLDALVVSGDFTQRARAGQFQKAADFLNRLPRPQLVIPGNHDIPLYNVAARFFWPLSNYRRFISPDLRPFWVDGELAILGINTSRSWSWAWDGFWKDGDISEEQLLDVKLRLCGLPPSMFKIVVTHHPFIPPPGERVHGIVHGAARALDMMVNCGVDLLLAGHLHMGYSGDVRTHHEAVKRSILSVQAGTATSNRRREEPNAYNLIVIDNHQVTITVRAWTGQHFAVLTQTRYARDNEVWQKVE
jgi:3',5'-cyclic AMP phosphodiesterase CpdA